jgi:hypothetical protein
VSATKDYLVKQAAIILNAATGTGAGDASVIGAIDDPKKYPFAFLGNFAIDSDAEVCMAVCQTTGHPLRKAFTTDSANLADGALIAPAAGGGEVYDIFNVKVDDVDARRKPVTFFKRLQPADPLNRTLIGKYYDLVDGNFIRHNGAVATAKVVRFAKGAAPQAPDSLTNASVSCLLSLATPKMDIWVSMASYFAQEWARREQMIRSGAVTIPPVVALQKMEQKV